MVNRTAAPSATRGRHAAERTGHRAAATVEGVTMSAGRRRLRAGWPSTPLTRRRQPSSTAVLLVATEHCTSMVACLTTCPWPPCRGRRAR
jgi:NTE family protein